MADERTVKEEEKSEHLTEVDTEKANDTGYQIVYLPETDTTSEEDDYDDDEDDSSDDY